VFTTDELDLITLTLASNLTISFALLDCVCLQEKVVAKKATTMNKHKKLFFLLLIVGIGTLFVFIAFKKVFDLLKIEYASYLFNQFQSYIHRIFEGVFQKAESTTEKIISKKQINDTFQYFLPKIPQVFQKPLLFVLSFTPMVGFVADIYATPTLNSHQRKSDALYEKVQLYMQNSVEEERRGYWVIWGLLINALLQGLLLYWL